MVHIALLGDSIFDNASYVGNVGMPVIEHLQRRIPADWKTTLAARDGSITTDVPEQVVEYSGHVQERLKEIKTCRFVTPRHVRACFAFRRPA